jgi:hypothetical protein
MAEPIRIPEGGRHETADVRVTAAALDVPEQQLYRTMTGARGGYQYSGDGERGTLDRQWNRVGIVCDGADWILTKEATPPTPIARTPARRAMPTV